MGRPAALGARLTRLKGRRESRREARTRGPLLMSRRRLSRQEVVAGQHTAIRIGYLQEFHTEPSAGLEPATLSLPSRLFSLFAGTEQVSRMRVLQDF